MIDRVLGRLHQLATTRSKRPAARDRGGIRRTATRAGSDLVAGVGLRVAPPSKRCGQAPPVAVRPRPPERRWARAPRGRGDV